MNIYLYLKTHNITGLKYLGKTVDDPFTYKGSGKYWKSHIKKHGYDVTTEILFETECPDEFRRVSLEYSDKLNIVENKDFANLVPENGDGGNHYAPHSEETKELLRQKGIGNTNKTGKKVLDTTNFSITMKKRIENGEWVNPMDNPKSVDKIRKKALIKHPCPHCGQEMNAGNLARHIKSRHIS